LQTTGLSTQAIDRLDDRDRRIFELGCRRVDWGGLGQAVGDCACTGAALSAVEGSARHARSWIEVRHTSDGVHYRIDGDTWRDLDTGQHLGIRSTLVSGPAA
jgi:hypothetical protein